MQFTQEPIPEERSQHSIGLHGPATPFRHWAVIRRYIQGMVNRRGYDQLVAYNTTVERAEKTNNEWILTLRKPGDGRDEWWQEKFDAVVVASGHFWVPYVPAIQGLEELERARPGAVLHSKHFRGKELFKNKRVVVVGASVSAADIAFDLTSAATTPVHAVTIGHSANGYFGDEAFNHPLITKRPSIARVDPVTRTVHFVDGTSATGIDHIIFGTGYTWTLPFLPGVRPSNNRIPGLYQHVVWRDDPSLLFVGAVAAGLTFKVFEWQAVLAARILAGRAILPPRSEQIAWEDERIKERGDGVRFTLIFPDFEKYFETLRRLAGPGEEGKGRQLPPFNKTWVARFLAGHEFRKQMWKRINAKATEELVSSTARSDASDFAQRAKL